MKTQSELTGPERQYLDRLRGAQPVAVPDVSVFYYPWYGTPARDGGWVHWTRPDTTSYASNYYPARGLYSSSDARVLLFP